jgi:hypothetical protein
MKRATTVIGAGLLGLASMTSPRTERAVPFTVGETLTFDVSWSSYLTAGTAVATVESKQPSRNSTAYKIVAEGRTLPLLAMLYALHYRVETLIDAYTLLPQHASAYSEEGRRTRTRATEFDRKAQPLAQDALSAIYTLRAAPLRAGARMAMPIIENGATYAARFDVSGPETVRTPLGTAAAWKVAAAAVDDKGKPAGRNMAMWISTDARRLPLKLQADLPVGTFNLMLREAR